MARRAMRTSRKILAASPDKPAELQKTHQPTMMKTARQKARKRGPATRGVRKSYRHRPADKVLREIRNRKYLSKIDSCLVELTNLCTIKAKRTTISSGSKHDD